MAKSQTQTSEQRIDPGAEAFRDFVFQQARGQAGVSQEQRAGFEQLSQIDPQVMQALQGLIPNLGFASQGFRQAQGGITGADINRFQDPFTEQVTNAAMADFARLRKTSGRDIGTAATRAGAFGGTRQGIAEGVALGELGRSEAGVLGDIRSRGFQSAVQAALASRQQGIQGSQGLANLGFGGMQGIEQMIGRSAGGQIGLGQLPWQNLMGLQGIMGSAPMGSTQTQTTGGSFLQSLIGAGATGLGFALGGPAGASMGSSLAGGGGGQQWPMFGG